MDRSLILETTFLIDLERERSRHQAGATRDFLERHGRCRLFITHVITHVIAGELAAGDRPSRKAVSLGKREEWEEFIRPFRILPVTAEVSWEYGVTYRYLQEQGRLIGGNDLWIGAAGLAYGMPVVTRNPEHFRRHTAAGGDPLLTGRHGAWADRSASNSAHSSCSPSMR